MASRKSCGSSLWLPFLALAAVIMLSSGLSSFATGSRLRSVVQKTARIAPRACGRRGLATGLGLAGLGLAQGYPIKSEAKSRRDLSVNASGKDLLVIGCGTLGERVARQWKASNPDNLVVGETKGTTRHSSFQEHGITPRLIDSEEGKAGEKFPYVVFSAPPSSSSDYVKDLERAISLWDKSGVLVFTSSGGAYAEEDGGIVTENSPTKDPSKSPRAKVLHDSEQTVLKADGTVVRLAGLYTLQRGAHSYWLSRAQVSGSPEGLINLIHYDDAAGLVVATMEAGDKAKGQVFLGSDDQPITRQEICEAAIRHPFYGSKFQMPTFTAQFGPKGKRYDNSATRDALQWQPKYPTFTKFMESSD